MKMVAELHTDVHPILTRMTLFYSTPQQFELSFSPAEILYTLLIHFPCQRPQTRARRRRAGGPYPRVRVVPLIPLITTRRQSLPMPFDFLRMTTVTSKTLNSPAKRIKAGVQMPRDQLSTSMEFVGNTRTKIRCLQDEMMQFWVA